MATPAHVATYNGVANKSAATAATATVTANVNDVLVAVVVCDDIANGEAISTTAVTDTAGHGWGRQASGQDTGLTAGDNVCVAIFTTKVVTAFVNGTVTFTPSILSEAKDLTVLRFANATPNQSFSGNQTNGSSGTPSVTITEPGGADVFEADMWLLGVVAAEGPTGDTFTRDSDTTDGAWSLATTDGTSGGAATTNVRVHCQWKILTGGSSTTQTFNPTMTSRDFQIILLVFDPATSTTVQGTQATESDTAFVGTPSVAYQGSMAVVTDVGLAGASRVSWAGALATESDAAQAGTTAAQVNGAQAAESDTALAGTLAVHVQGVQATEADIGRGGTPQVAVAGVLATEADTALAGVAATHQEVQGVLATEEDTAVAGTSAFGIAGAQATETDTAFVGTTAQGTFHQGVLAEEADIGLTGTSSMAVPGALATEANTAFAGVTDIGVPGVLATETDTAFAGSMTIVVIGSLATEIDTAFAGSVEGPPVTGADTGVQVIGNRTMLLTPSGAHLL